MAKFLTEVHATLDELIELVGKWMAEYPIVATAEAFPPSRTMPVTLENFREVLARPEVHEVLFTEGPVKRPAQSVYDILSEHPGGLSLQIGRCESRGLEQSTLGTMDANPMWKKINRELKKLTTAGATVVWEDGRSAFDRNARFSAGAKALAASGVPLRQSRQSTFVYQPK